MGEDDKILEDVGSDIANHLDHIAACFKPGLDIKVTLIVRVVGYDKADLMMSNDTIENVRAVLDRTANEAHHKGEFNRYGKS